jgi:glutathione S-transferase
MNAPAYRAINPMGKVPALRHGDTIVTECAAICACLADAFSEAGLAPPAEDRQRGPYYRWLFFGAGPIEAATTNKALGFVVPQGSERMAGYGSPDEVFATLEAAVSRARYLVGDDFTTADLYVGALIGWGMMFGTIDRRPPSSAIMPASALARRRSARRTSMMRCWPNSGRRPRLPSADTSPERCTAALDLENRRGVTLL